MKPIFCTDITVNKNNNEINGTNFITESISDEKREEMDARANELQSLINQAKAPGWMVTLRSVAGFASLIMAMNLFQVVMEKGFSALFAADQITGTLICLGAVAVWFYMDHQGKARVKKMESDPLLKKKNDELEIEIAMMMHEMGVPANAKPMDVLVFNYKEKDGEVTPISPMMMPSTFMNFECKAYVKDDEIRLADSDSVYSFKKSEIKMLRKVDSKITVYSWNKQEDPTDPKYSEYGVFTNKMGMASVAYYYVVEIERDGVTFGLYVPGYEAEILKDVFGFDRALDADGDMVPLAQFDEISDEGDDEDNVAENALPEAEDSEVEENAAEAENTEESDIDEAEEPTDEPENSEEEEASTDETENSEEEEDSKDEEAYDEADTNESESDEEPEEAVEETKE